MAENNLEEIKESVKFLGDTLDSMRNDNLTQAQNTEKAIVSIKTSLDEITNGDDTELIKVFLEELQKTLLERHQFVTDKFKKIERSFKALVERADDALKPEDIKNIFDNIASNFNVFSKNVANQKDILSEINTKVAEIRTDDSKKRDIMRSIAVVKTELEKFNNGFESIVININDNFQNLSAAFDKVDAREAFSTLKKDMENVYMSINSVLSTLQVIDKKNRDLDKAVENMISFNDFEEHKRQVADLIAQNAQMTDLLNGVADKKSISGLVQKIDTAVGIINALKNVMDEKSNQNQQMLAAQLEKLESTASEIVSEEDFSKFRAELLRVVESGIQSSNLVRAELLDTNAELKNLFKFLNSFEIKSNFQQTGGLIKASEESVKESVRELSDKISQNSEQYKTLITTDINNNIDQVSKNIEGVESRLRDYTKDSTSQVIQNIEEIVSQINSVKEDVHVENMENMENVQDKFEEIKANVTLSKDNINKIAKGNFENIISNMAAIVQKIDVLNADLTQSSKDTLKNTVISLEKMTKEIGKFAETYKDASLENRNDIVKEFSTILPKFEDVKELLVQILNQKGKNNEENFAQLKENLEVVKNELNQMTQGQAENILAKISDMNAELESTVQNILNNAGDVQSASLNAGIQDMAGKIEYLKTVINENSKENFSSVLSVVEKFSQQISTLKDFFAQNNEENAQEISSKINDVSGRFEWLRSEISKNNQAAAENLLNEIKNVSENFENTVSEKLAQKNEELSQNTKANFDELYNQLNEFKANLLQSTRENFDSLLPLTDKFSEAIESVKNSFNSVTTQNIDQTVSRVVDGLTEEISSSNGNLIQLVTDKAEYVISSLNEGVAREIIDAQNNINNFTTDKSNDILCQVNNLKDELARYTEDIRQFSGEKADNITVKINGIIAAISEKFELEGNEINKITSEKTNYIVYNLKEIFGNFEKLLSEKFNADEISQHTMAGKVISEVSDAINNLHEALQGESEENAQDFKDLLQVLNGKVESITGVFDELTKKEDIKGFAERLSNELNDVKHSMETNSKLLVETSMPNFDKVAEKLNEGFREEFAGCLNSQNSHLEIKFAELSDKISWIKNNTSEATAQNFEGIKNEINSLAETIATVQGELNGKAQINFDNTVNAMHEISSQMEVFINEHLAMQNNQIDEKLQNVQGLTDKIQSLTDEILENNNAFKNDIAAEISSVKELVNNSKDDLNNADLTLSEDFSRHFSGLENVINQKQTEFSNNLEDLQVRLIEYIENLQNKNGDSEFKLDDIFGKCDTVESQTEEISKDLAILKNANRQNLTEITDKLEDLKDGVHETEVSLKEELDVRTSELAGNFSTLNEAIDRVAQFDFTVVTSDIKEFVEKINDDLSGQIRANAENQSVEILKQINEAFGTLNTKSLEFEERVTASDERVLQNVEALKSLLDNLLDNAETLKRIADNTQNFEEVSEQFRSVEDLVMSEGNKTSEIVKSAIQSVIDKIEESKTNYLDVNDLINSSKEDILNDVLSAKDEIKLDLNTSKEDLFEKFSEEKMLLNATSERIDSSKDELSENINLSKESILNNLLSAKDELKSDLNSSKDDIFEKFAEGNATLNEASEKIEASKDELSQNINSSKESILSDLLSAKDEIKLDLNTSKDDIFEKFAEEKTILNETSQKIDLSKDELIEDINSSKSAILDSQHETSSQILDEIDKNSEIAKNALDKINSSKEDLTEEINSVKTTIEESNSNQTDLIKEELNSMLLDISKMQDKVDSYKVDIAGLLQVSDDEFKAKLASIEDTIANEVSSNLENFRDTIRTSAQEIQGKLSLSEDTYKSTTEELLKTMSESFTDKVEDGFDDLKSFFEVVEERNDFAKMIDDAKFDIFNKFGEIKDGFEESLQNAVSEEDFDNLNDKLKISVSELLEDFQNSLKDAIENDAISQDTFSNTEEILKRADELSSSVSEEIGTRLDSFKEEFEKQKEDFTNLISEIKVSVEDLKEAYTDLSVNSSMEMSQLLVGIDEKITCLQEKTENLDFKDIIENSNKNISDKIDELSQKLDTLAIQNQPEVEPEEDKEIEIEPEETMDFEKVDLAAQVDEIKENISKQAQLLENLKVLEKLNSLSKLDGIDAIQENVQEILDKFDGKITSMQAAEPVNEEEATGLNAELEKVKGELLECILNVFDQISFVSEAEDIKDFVSEQADGVKKYAKNQTAEIKQFVNGQLNGIKQLNLDVKEILDGQSEQVGTTIKSALGDNFDNIISSLNTLNEKTETSNGSLDDIKQNIEYVKAHVLALHEEAHAKLETPEEDEDGYTLQDVETDIAKLRLVLNEIAEASKKTEEDVDDSAIDSFSNLEYLDKLNNLDKMNEDLMSISSRTNKLLLNSDESYNALKTNLDTFKDVVSTLDQKVQYMDTTDINKRIEHKLEKVNALVQTSVKSDKIFNKALMYLAEWVDTASENMNSITERVEKVSELDELKKSMTELKKALPESNAEKLLEQINTKFEAQQEYIERLEAKIEKLTTEKKSSKTPKTDVEAIVNAVVEKLSTTVGDKKSETKLAKKVDGIEKQLTELTDGIKKLTSYVDE